MALRISCPSCRRALKVPDDLAGREVRCPSCLGTFRVAPPPEGPPATSGYNVRIPTSLPPRESDDDDRSGADERDDEEGGERRERKRRRRQTNEARSKCLIPGIILIVLALINVAGMGLNIVANIADRDENSVPAIVVSSSSILASGVILFGAIQMIRLQNWGLAVTSAALCVVPCVSPCCILGIPFGVWGLIVLLDGDVKRSFT